MIAGLLTFATLLSAIFFPWPLTALLALIASYTEPLVPLAAGLLADTLYYSPHAGSLPLFTFFGTIVSAIAFFVRSRLRTGTMQ